LVLDLSAFDRAVQIIYKFSMGYIASRYTREVKLMYLEKLQLKHKCRINTSTGSNAVCLIPLHNRDGHPTCILPIPKFQFLECSSVFLNFLWQAAIYLSLDAY